MRSRGLLYILIASVAANKSTTNRTTLSDVAVRHISGIIKMKGGWPVEPPPISIDFVPVHLRVIVQITPDPFTV